MQLFFISLAYSKQILRTSNYYQLPMIGSIFAFVLGALVFFVLIKLLSSLYRILFPYWLAVPRKLKVLAGAEWAVVTGGSDGIGKAYAVELAKLKFNLVIISRTEAKLKKIATEIGELYDVEVRTIVFDFTNANYDDYERKIFGVLSQLQIGLLGKSEYCWCKACQLNLFCF